MRRDPSYLANQFRNDLNTKFTNEGYYCLDNGWNSKDGNYCDDNIAFTGGQRDFQNAIGFLDHIQTSKQLTWSNGLAQACRDLVLDIGPGDRADHSSHHGSIKSRADRYANSKEVSEVITFSKQMDSFNKEAEWMVKSLIIDDGHYARKDRDVISDGDFTHAGVACGCHSTYGDMCCVMVGRDVRDKVTGWVDSIDTVSKDQCKDYV